MEMGGKDKLFAATLAVAFALNIFCVVSTVASIRNPGTIWSEGNPIQRAILSVSHWLAFLVPFLMLGIVYLSYKWNKNVGLVLAGGWLGIEISDFLVHLYCYLV